MAHALRTFLCRGALRTRVNPDTIGCVWTGEFDNNTLRVDGEICESGKKKLRIQKYPDTCGRGLSDFQGTSSAVRFPFQPTCTTYSFLGSKV